MAKVSDYYNEVYVLSDDPIDSTQAENVTFSEQENQTSFTPRIQTQSATQRIGNTSETRRKKQTVLSLYDEDHYALPDLTEVASTPVPPALSASTKSNTATKCCKLKYSTSCALITCVSIFVLGGAITTGIVFLVKEPSMNDAG